MLDRLHRASSRTRKLTGFALAIPVGAGLAVASHHWHWSEGATQLVGMGVVALMVILLMPWMMGPLVRLPKDPEARRLKMAELQAKYSPRD